MAVVRNRRALVTAVQPFDANERGRLHLVDVEYTDGIGAESDQLLWEVEPGTELLEPTALPRIDVAPPMDTREFDAMVRAARWSALTPSLPFSGLEEDRPAPAAHLFGAVHPEPYQIVPVLRALEMPRVALMLADAVGLGKTIQAGMILRELMLRRRIRRVLILCPASLRTQWREELDQKFSLPFEVVDRPHTLRLQRELGLDANPWRIHERIIASYHYLKQPDVLEQFRVTAEPTEGGQLRWDLLIVDEAHNLAPASFGEDSDVSRLLQQIALWFDHRIFLSATPHNGHTRSFSGLLESLDPVRFTRKSELTAEDRARIAETVIRRLKSTINHSYTARGEPARFSERHVEALPELRFGEQELALAGAFHRFRKSLHKVTASAPASERSAAAFAAEVLQKRLLSGPWAFGQSWLNLLEGLSMQSLGPDSVARVTAISADDTDNDAERESRQRQADRTVGGWLHQWRDTLSEEIADVSSAISGIGIIKIPAGLELAAHWEAVAAAANCVKTDVRLEALEILIEDRLRGAKQWKSGPGAERLIVFTEYLATLEYLSVRLRAKFGAGEWLSCLFGGMTDQERDTVKDAFNNPESPVRILLATDAAGEGLNLQRSCRLLLHWDIPWNPGKMEQRNGRLDRHGQERDVYIFHFDSSDEASVRFLGKVLKKRSQTREDRVATDEIFAQALLAHFQAEADAQDAENRLDFALTNARSAQRDLLEDIPDSQPLPGAQDSARSNELRADLDLTPHSLRETLETAMAIGIGRPRLKPDEQGRDRLVHPVPPAWQEVVDQTLRQGGPTGALCALVFDPEHYVRLRSGRPVFLPEPDSRLLHLGHALFHRVMSTFARYRFPGSPQAATRWCARSVANLPWDALVLVTLEELAVNELRESCYHWVHTIALPVIGGVLGAPLEEGTATQWTPAMDSTSQSVDVVRSIWDSVDQALKAFIARRQKARTAELKQRLAIAGERVTSFEKERFQKRRRELDKAVSDNQLLRLEQEIAAYLGRRQQYLFAELDEEERRSLADKEAELALRRQHYETVIHRLSEEEKRTVDRILPARYCLRGQAHVYPVAVEIRVPVKSP